MSPLTSVPSNFSNFTTPPLVISSTMYGPNQCVFIFFGCLKILLTYIRTRPPTSKWLLVMCLSCHTFYLCFYTIWWNPATKQSSSNYTSWSNLYCTASTSVILVIVATLKLDTIYSIGMKTYFPYTNRNGVWPVNFLHVVWYAHNTTEIFWS